MAYLFGSVALAGMFGGLLATGITKIGHAHGLNAWSWLYIIEGCISFIAAAWVFWGLPNNPSEAKFWKPEEKAVMVARDRQRQEYLGNLNFEWVEVGRALKDPKVWLWYADFHHPSPRTIELIYCFWCFYPILPRHCALRLQHFLAVYS